MVDFLDENLWCKLNQVFNSHDLFFRDETEKQNFNLICAMMDRVKDSAAWLRAYSDKFNNSDDALLFMVHACIIRDAIRTTAWKLGIEYNNILKKYPPFFECICRKDLGIHAGDVLDDDQFFEYLRSLVFAHPLETSRALGEKETQYSPFIRIEDYIKGENRNSLIIHVYSNVRSDLIIIHVPIESLKGYLQSRYLLLENITSELRRRILDKENIWRQRKVNRDGTPIEILEDILKIQEERFIRTYEIRNLMSILTCKCTLPENMESLNKVRKAIINTIPAICDALDDMDYENFFELVDGLVDARPERTYEAFGYHMEKIFSYLDTGVHPSDKIWGLRQADEFSKEFAKKWVKIDVNTMDDEEIKVLVMAACYLETQEQNQGA